MTRLLGLRYDDHDQIAAEKRFFYPDFAEEETKNNQKLHVYVNQ